jgi:hypothetical protein
MSQNETCLAIQALIEGNGYPTRMNSDLRLSIEDIPIHEIPIWIAFAQSLKQIAQETKDQQAIQAGQTVNNLSEDLKSIKYYEALTGNDYTRKIKTYEQIIKGLQSRVNDISTNQDDIVFADAFFFLTIMRFETK